MSNQPFINGYGCMLPYTYCKENSFKIHGFIGLDYRSVDNKISEGWYFRSS